MHKLKYGQFHLNIKRYFFSVIEVNRLRNRLPREVFEFPSLEIVHSLGQLAVADPALKRGVD